MIRRNTWVVLGVFVALLLVVIYLPKMQAQAEPTPDVPAAPPAALFDFGFEDIQAITISDAAGQQAAYQRTDEIFWEMTAPSMVPAEGLDLMQVIASIAQLTDWRELTAISPINDLTVVGLYQPAYTIEVLLTSGEVVEVFVGDLTITEAGYYVRQPGGLPQVVEAFAVDAVLNLLVRPALLPTATPEVMLEGTPAAPPVAP